ncbi:MAG: pknH 1 [Solirubrobacterales bacterium]|nr:pknH 1 [Solirubrobacterales bacterium]
MTPSLPLVGEDFAGYRLRAVLGRGGMSVVYEAENLRLGSTIALKVLAPELSGDDVFRARFLKESRIAASLSHPNVIPIYDTGPHEELLYIAMRYVDGSDLRSVLNARERISPGQALLLIGQAGRALDAAHRHGLVHRDVKPANILIERGADDDPDHVYLADFGITKHTLSRSGLTATGQFVGTIDYIAPEQIRDKYVDGRADIYSLGCVLYECLTGHVPFVKDLDAAVIWAHVEELPVPPSTVRAQLPPAIDEVIGRALAKDPDDRYPTCREFVGAVRTALAPMLHPPASTAPDHGAASAGPPTVLSGGHVPEYPAPGAQPAESTSGTTLRDGGSHAGTPAAVPPLAVQSGGGGPGSLETRLSADQPMERGGPAGDGRSSRRGGRGSRRIAALGVIVLVVAVGAVTWAATRGGSKASGTQNAGEPRSAALAPVPTNHVQGNGTATLRLNAYTASVTVTTTGLLDGSPHLMHIHAGGLGTCPPASAARLHNGHLAISTEDGIKYYGPPEASLTTTGDARVASYLAFDRFPRVGDIRYRRTIQISRSLAEQMRANKAVVVIHGIDYDSRGIYDNVLSHSELLPTVPGEATAPALCGALVAVTPAATASAPSRGSDASQVYVADLTVETGALASWCEAVPPPSRPRRARDRLNETARA